jgi:hypothetical protein
MYYIVPVSSLQMLRTSIIRSASVLARPHISHSLRPLVGQSIRFETTKTPDRSAFKAAQELNDNLQRDWDAKELTYEELKPKTSSPTPVSSYTFQSITVHSAAVGHVLGRCP